MSVWVPHGCALTFNNATNMAVEQVNTMTYTFIATRTVNGVATATTVWQMKQPIIDVVPIDPRNHLMTRDPPSR